MDPSPTAPGPARPGRTPSAWGLTELRAALGADFDVIRLLGHGSVASVFLARDRALNALFAIKVLNPAKAVEETARRRFEREGRAAAALADHPNTVAVSRYGRLDDGTPYLVMQYVKGRTLYERLQAEGSLSLTDAVGVLADVAAALAFAHEKGIVHRDVQPRSVLWDEERQRARLTDFGLAAVMSYTGVDTSRLTQTGQLLGDPKYLSPEQLDDQDHTELTDMYLFGVMGYDLLTGRGPYDARTPADWIHAHQARAPLDVRELRADVPAPLAELLRRCLSKEPNHRPSAVDVAVALGADAPGLPMRPGDGKVASALAGREPGDLKGLIEKRVPQIVLLTAGLGVTVIGLTEALGDYLPEDSMLYVVVFVVASVVASGVIAWFHGERGPQKAPAIEYLLLGLIAAGWLAVTVMVAVS